MAGKRAAAASGSSTTTNTRTRGGTSDQARDRSESPQLDTTGLAPDVARRLARKERNRKAAQASRDRKRVQLEELEAENNELRAQIATLKTTVNKLRAGGGHVDFGVGGSSSTGDGMHEVASAIKRGRSHDSREPASEMDEDAEGEADLGEQDELDGDDMDDDKDGEFGAKKSSSRRRAVNKKPSRSMLRNIAPRPSSSSAAPSPAAPAANVPAPQPPVLSPPVVESSPAPSTTAHVQNGAPLGFAPPKPPSKLLAGGAAAPSSSTSDFTALAALGRAASRAARHDRNVDSGVSSSSSADVN